MRDHGELGDTTRKLEAFKMLAYHRILKNPLVGRMTNQEVLKRLSKLVIVKKLSPECL